MRQLLAAWMVIHERDIPMNPRLLGKPGVGKTTMAYAAGKRLGREVYIFQATVDTRPEDLLITPVIESASQLKYVASPLLTAGLQLTPKCVIGSQARKLQRSRQSHCIRTD